MQTFKWTFNYVFFCAILTSMREVLRMKGAKVSSTLQHSLLVDILVGDKELQSVYILSFVAFGSSNSRRYWYGSWLSGWKDCDSYQGWRNNGMIVVEIISFQKLQMLIVKKKFETELSFIRWLQTVVFTLKYLAKNQQTMTA